MSTRELRGLGVEVNPNIPEAPQITSQRATASPLVFHTAADNVGPSPKRSKASVGRGRDTGMGQDLEDLTVGPNAPESWMDDDEECKE